MILRLLLPLLLVTGLVAADSEDSGAWPTAATAPAFVWADAGADNRVAVPNRSRPRQCTLSVLLGRARFGRFGELVAIDGAGYADVASAQRIREQSAEAQALSFEFVLAPLAADEGPVDGVILDLGALYEVPMAGGFAIDCADGELRLHHAGGIWPLGALPAERTSHWLVSLDPDAGITTYRDGDEVGAHAEPLTAFGRWSEDSLSYGADRRIERPWRGRLERLAVYPATLAAETAAAHAAHWAAEAAAREELPELRVTATLAEVSRGTDPGSYPRSLVAYRYRVESVEAGELEAEHIVIYHWSALGGEVEQAIVDREPGTRYELDLAPAAAFPMLESEHKFEDVFDPDAPLFYDLAP